MTAEEATIQALRQEVAELQLRVEELGAENHDLRELCDEKGVPYKDRLAARLHSRCFAKRCVAHPLGATATASDVLGAPPIARGIAEHAGAVLCTGLIARCFFAAFTQLTALFPWKFGYRVSATFDATFDADSEASEGSESSSESGQQLRAVPMRGLRLLPSAAVSACGTAA